ncbi:MAG: DUF87 domain-containing protein, partial [Bdellovibrionales bacterium]|nr:DUF87 domain-containing protein [Bdellovibrionales bacterium]
MKTFAVLIPREAYTQTDAIVETGFKITKGSIFEQTLNELQDAINDIFALELFTTRQTTALCFTAAGPVIDIICGELYAILPRAEIREIPDFTYDYDENCEIATAEVRLGANDIYPIKGQNRFQIDSMTPILSVLTRFPHEGKFIVQLVVKPVRDTAKHHFDLRQRVITDATMHHFHAKYWFKRGVRKEVVEKITEKCHRPMFRVNMRIAAILPGAQANGAASDRVYSMMKAHKHAEEYIQAIFGGYTEVNTIDLNRLVLGKILYGEKGLKKFQDRDLTKPWRLTPNELSALWHPPGVSEGKNLATLLSKKGSPPKLLPCDLHDDNICFFGKTDYREKIVPFGIKREDRARHMYIVGKSGTGKSKLIQLLAKNDIEAGHGCAILDPHGDLVDDILKLVPRHRINDVVLFDPSDLQYPPSFNPLVQVPDELKMRVTIGFLEIFKKVFSSNWSDRMEHVLRYSIIALLSTPGATLLSIRKMLIDPNYRAVIALNVHHQLINTFLTHP